MKKLVLFLSLMIVLYSTNAQYVDIPDSNFRNFLQHQYPGCFNTAGEMDTTCSNILNEQSLTASSLSLTNVDALKYFKNLILFDCSNNQITSLPALPALLQQLYCDNNNLTSLPEIPYTLNQLNFRKNKIHCLPKLPRPADYIQIRMDVNSINCIPNIGGLMFIEQYDSMGNNVNNGIPPLCNPTNNISGCQSFPIMNGIVFYDANSNGIRDVNEHVKANTEITLSNNNFTYTNNDGYYEINTDSIGTHSLSAIAPDYFNTAPITYNYNFTNYDTIVTGNFALEVDTVIDQLGLHITPINSAARPGFIFSYLISFENTGTTILSPTIVFNYDDTRLIYDSSNIAVVNNGNNLSLSAGIFVPGQQQSFTAYFKVKPTATIGDSLLSKATASASSYQVADSNITIIRGSYDPNDKQATPQLSPSQVANGDYIDYTIRFQNTGTDTAFNIVVSDTISEDLQTNTLQIINSSHNCKATVKDNIVFFEFLNILLPDSNINELKSHGFVSFRIKPQTSVSVNSTITNKAAIYFDYNTPVITNTANTLIKEFTVVPLKLISFSAVPQNDNTTTLYWNTANEINTKQFLIERSNDGLRFNAVTNIFAKGKANNNYNTTVVDVNTGIVFYRLKIIDNDGSFAYSPIIKIDKRKNVAGFSILSNPVKDLLVISTTDKTLNNTQVNIINMQGAIVKTFIVKEGSQTIEIKDLPNGIYYLRTANGSNRFLVQ